MRASPFGLTRSAQLAAAVCAATLAICTNLAAEAASPSKPPSVTIAVPAEGAAAVGETVVEIVVSPANVQVRDVVILVDGFEVCRLEAPPWSCRWDAGPRVAEHHLRAVVTLPDGDRLIASRRTTSLDVDEAVRVLAVQVPVLVSNSQGRYERGLTPDQFTLLEDGRPQRIDTVFDDSLPLELVVAVDMSASMEGEMAEVRDAVKRFLARLRPGDTATILGFNETMFVLADRESDPDLRDAAVEALLPWGGTALYDATVRAVELVREQTGRRGVVVFSDGDDLHSIMRREEALARIEEGQVVVYTVGFGRAGTDRYRDTLAAFAGASGGRAFFPGRSSDLDDTFAQILDELSHQYVLSYVSNAADERGWRRLEVKAGCEGCRVRAREGYRVSDP